MNKNKNYMQIWGVVYPVLLYFAISVFLMFVLQSLLGNGTEHYAICKIISTLVIIPVLYFEFYAPDQKLWSVKRTMRAADIKEILFIVLMASCIGIGLNNLISMSPLMSVSQGYTEATSYFYGSSLAIELVSSAILTPIAEELIYRGILFGRLRRMSSLWVSIFLSSLFFAWMHFNLVQFLYAGLFGIVLAMIMERYGNVLGAIVAHMTANTIAVLRTETGVFNQTVDGTLVAWFVSVSMLLMGIAMLLLYWKKEK